MGLAPSIAPRLSRRLLHSHVRVESRRSASSIRSAALLAQSHFPSSPLTESSLSGWATSKRLSLPWSWLQTVLLRWCNIIHPISCKCSLVVALSSIRNLGWNRPLGHSSLVPPRATAMQEFCFRDQYI